MLIKNKNKIGRQILPVFTENFLCFRHSCKLLTYINSLLAIGQWNQYCHDLHFLVWKLEFRKVRKWLQVIYLEDRPIGLLSYLSFHLPEERALAHPGLMKSVPEGEVMLLPGQYCRGHSQKMRNQIFTLFTRQDLIIIECFYFSFHFYFKLKGTWEWKLTQLIL